MHNQFLFRIVIACFIFVVLGAGWVSAEDKSKLLPKKEQQRLKKKINPSIPTQSSQAISGKYVSCPLGEVSANVTTALPSPWWSTEQGARVVSSEVMTLGGRKILVCNYEAYDGIIPVMRDLPAGTSSCVPRGNNGFDCR